MEGAFGFVFEVEVGGVGVVAGYDGVAGLADVVAGAA